MWKKINCVFDKLVSLTDLFGSASLLVILFCCLIQVVARKMDISVLWTEELARYSFVLLVFIGSIYATRHVQHISATIFLDKLPLSFRRYADIVIYFGVIFINLILSYSGWILFQNTSPVMRASALAWLRMKDFYLVVSIACFLNAAAALFRILELIFDKTVLLREQQAAEAKIKAEEQQIMREYQSVSQEEGRQKL